MNKAIIIVESGVAGDPKSPRYMQGFVKVTYGNEVGQLTMREANELAMSLVQAACMADQDALMMRFLTEKVELDVQNAARLLVEFREMRG